MGTGLGPHLSCQDVEAGCFAGLRDSKKHAQGDSYREFQLADRVMVHLAKLSQWKGLPFSQGVQSPCHLSYQDASCPGVPGDMGCSQLP